MNTWTSAWESILGLPATAPNWIVAIAAILCTYFFVIFPSGAIVSYLERKFGADLQARVGPNRAGPGGIFQPAADLIKILQKETRLYSSWGERFWLGIHTMALYSTLAVIPLGSATLLVDTDMSALIPFWAALMLGLGAMLLGLNQGSVQGWFGGLRVAGQSLVGAFPALICLVCAGIRAGGFKWSAFSLSQGASPLAWAIFSNPFQMVAFTVFVMSGLVLLNVPPLDGGLSIPDIHGGVSSHLYGRQLSLFRLGRFYVFFLWSVIAVVLFLGGWNLPESLYSALASKESFRLLQIFELWMLLIKVFFLMLLVVWVARVTPRVRVDQVMGLTWEILSPLSLMALVGTAAWTIWKIWI